MIQMILAYAIIVLKILHQKELLRSHVIIHLVWLAEQLMEILTVMVKAIMLLLVINKVHGGKSISTVYTQLVGLSFGTEQMAGKSISTVYTQLVGLSFGTE